VPCHALSARNSSSRSPHPHCSGFPPRRSFKSRVFAAKYGLRPVAVLTYTAQWDEAVPGLAASIAPPADGEAPAPAPAPPAPPASSGSSVAVVAGAGLTLD